VAGTLREQILDGALRQGVRLPNETVLATEFGVSRATVREALRLLAAQDLIRTAKGAGGGSYVTLPSVDHISEALRSGIGLLASAEDVSLEELLEARELLEVPAARLAALRRSDEDVERLREAIPEEPLRLGTSEQFVYNRDFHSVVIESSRNTLLSIAAQPVFAVLQTHLARSKLGAAFHRAVNEHHVAIAAAIEAGGTRAAEREMHAHLEFLRPFYEQAWRSCRGDGGAGDRDGEGGRGFAGPSRSRIGRG
jgi:GntR family transcriptional repressor for pyruvate dehydrogenase complex